MVSLIKLSKERQKQFPVFHHIENVVWGWAQERNERACKGEMTLGTLIMKREGRDRSPGPSLTFDDATALPNSLVWGHVHLVHCGQQLLVGLQSQVHPAKVDGKW